MRQSRGGVRGLMWAVVATFGVACGGGDGGGAPSGPAPVPGTLTVAVTPSSDSVQAGSSKSAAVQISRGGSFAGAVTLAVEGAPSGVSVTPASTTLAAGTTSSSLTISVDSSVAPGAYPMTVRATGAGVSAATATYRLTVTEPPPPAPDFRVELAQTTFSVQQGDSTATSVIVRRLGGLLGDVGIFVSSAPLDVQVRITPPTVSDTIASLRIAVPVSVAPGTYPMVLIATSSGGLERTVNLMLVVTPKPSAGVLTLSPSLIQVTQTIPSDPIVVRLARPAGVTGPIALSLENLPVGFTGTFTPNPAGGDSALLVLTLSQLAPAGVNTIRVRATVGDNTSTADLVVTSRTFVPPDFALRLSPTVAAVTAGSNTTATVEVVRTNFTDPVALTVSGLPIGMAATVTPPSASGDSAQLAISTAASVAPGIYPVTVTGTAAGIAGTRTATLSLTVNAPAGGANVQWQFCAPARFPLWFGVRSGTTGAWTAVNPVSNASGVGYTFAFDQPGQLAYVQNTADGVQITVFNTRPQEILAQAANECATHRPTKTISGRIVNGINVLRGASISAGGANTVIPAGGTTFTLTGVKEGVTDIIAYLGVPTANGWSQFDRIIMRRDVNPANGAVIDDFDFAGSEWLFNVAANFRFFNLGGELITVTRSYLTANGNVGTIATYGARPDSSFGLSGIPAALRRPGELHVATATTVNATAPRTVTSYNTNFNSQPMVFGPTLAAPTVSVLGTGPVRLRAEGTWSSDYGSTVTATFTQAAPNGRRVELHASREFFAGNSYTLETPDFASAPGFNATWLLRAGVPVTHNVTATGVGVGVSLTPADGTHIISASRIGTVTP